MVLVDAYTRVHVAWIYVFIWASMLIRIHGQVVIYVCVDAFQPDIQLKGRLSALLCMYVCMHVRVQYDSSLFILYCFVLADIQVCRMHVNIYAYTHVLTRAKHTKTYIHTFYTRSRDTFCLQGPRQFNHTQTHTYTHTNIHTYILHQVKGHVLPPRPKTVSSDEMKVSKLRIEELAQPGETCVHVWLL